MSAKNYILIIALYFSQFIPLAFFIEAFPAYLRMQGVSFGMLGILHLAFLPWMLKFLWAPLIDKYSFLRAGHYKGWIFLMQVLAASTLVIILSFVGINEFYILLALVLVFSFFSATQDIAADALAVNILKKSERGIANGIQNAAHLLGSIVGGGIMLYALASFGWKPSVGILALVMFLPVIPLYFSKEKPVAHPVKIEGYLSPFKSFFKTGGNKLWLLFLIAAPLSINMNDFILKPFMIDSGFSLESVAAIRSIFGLSAGFVGVIAGGVMIKKFGRLRSLSVFSFLAAFSVLYYAVPVYIEMNYTVIVIITLLTKFIAGMLVTALFTIVMDKSRQGTAGTDFSMQIALLTTSSHFLSSFLAGIILSAGGYTLLFICSTLFSLIPLYLLFYTRIAYRIRLTVS